MSLFVHQKKSCTGLVNDYESVSSGSLANVRQIGIEFHTKKLLSPLLGSLARASLTISELTCINCILDLLLTTLYKQHRPEVEILFKRLGI